MSEHADLEALSAFVDGEAPEWAAHVAGCEPCRSTVEALRAVRAAVAAPVEPVPAGQRDQAVAAALRRGSGSEPAALSSPARAAARPARWMVPASIAALFVLVAAAASLLTQGGTSVDRATTAGPAAESAPQSGLMADSRGAPPTTSADLGEIVDATALLDRARPGLVVTGSAGAPVAVAPAGAGGSAARGTAAAPPAAGARPCEERARAREPALREVVYFATATRQGVPAYVLGFSTGPSPAPLTLLMLVQDGCAVLLRAAGP